MSVATERRSAIAARLRMAREFSGLSQSQVADFLGIHRPSISEMEAGRRKVSAEELTNLAGIYDVDMAWLSGENSETNDDVKARVELAARELAKLNPDDLDSLLELLKTLRVPRE